MFNQGLPGGIVGGGFFLLAARFGSFAIEFGHLFLLLVGELAVGCGVANFLGGVVVGGNGVVDGFERREEVGVGAVDAPSLLSPGEVRTFLHEFGHALHGLFSRTRYASLSGTNVYRDFVELPSQFNENFLTQRAFLDTFARHYLTGEPISDTDVDRIVADARFGVAYACWRQLGFGYVDMAWHTATAPVDDAEAFERRAMAPVKIFEPIDGALFSPQFSHIFAGGYAAGYYSYKWSEMLDADAFELFLENGVTDRATANRFRREILERGGSADPMTLYVNFRGQAPSPEALLRRDSLR